MNWQDIIVYIIVASTLLTVIYKIYRKLFSRKAKKKGCSECNCTDCPLYIQKSKQIQQKS